VRLLFDENLSFRLIGALDSEFPGSVHVRSAGLARAGDMAIWQYARQHGLAIVTLDSDFHDIGVLHGAPPKIVWLRSLDTSTRAMRNLLSGRAAEIRAFGDDPTIACLVLYARA